MVTIPRAHYRGTWWRLKKSHPTYADVSENKILLFKAFFFVLCVVKTFINFASPFNLLSFFSSFMFLLSEAVKIIKSHYYMHNCFWVFFNILHMCIFITYVARAKRAVSNLTGLSSW